MQHKINCTNYVYIDSLYVCLFIAMFCILLMQELLPMHTSHVQCQKAGPAFSERHQHCRDDVWRSAQPSLWEVDGSTESTNQANPVSFPVLD
jgi:hypothetical protein